jgi:glycosyltransferase involved in cell wall biosynthesis
MDALFYLADQNPHRDRSRGITAYTRGLIAGLLASGVEITVLTSRSSYKVEGDVRHLSLPFRTNHLVGRMAADFIHPLWIPPLPLVHYPKGFLPGLRPKSALLCGTVHDLILQHYIDHYPASRSRVAFSYWLQVLKRSLPRFDFIVTVSEFSATAIREFCFRHRLVCPPIRVTWEGCRWEGEPLRRVEKRACLLHLGSREPHKRTATLIEYWRALAIPDLKLVVVGSVTEEVQRSIWESTAIELLPALPEDKLKTLLSESRALLLPSEVEGFGLPALEAYALGTPVVYVRGTAVEELLGASTPGGFDLAAPDSLRWAIESVLKLSAAEIVVTRLRLLQRYSWSECVRKTMASYGEFLGAE